MTVPIPVAMAPELTAAVAPVMAEVVGAMLAAAVVAVEDRKATEEVGA